MSDSATDTALSFLAVALICAAILWAGHRIERALTRSHAVSIALAPTGVLDALLRSTRSALDPDRMVEGFDGAKHRVS